MYVTKSLGDNTPPGFTTFKMLKKSEVNLPHSTKSNCVSYTSKPELEKKIVDQVYMNIFLI